MTLEFRYEARAGHDDSDTRADFIDFFNTRIKPALSVDSHENQVVRVYYGMVPSAILRKVLSLRDLTAPFTTVSFEWLEWDKANGWSVEVAFVGPYALQALM